MKEPAHSSGGDAIAAAEAVALPAATVEGLRRFLAASRRPAPQPAPALPNLGLAGERLREQLAVALAARAPVLLSLHIPKTAGSTFSRLLGEVFGDGLFLQYWVTTDRQGRPVADFPAGTRCVHGHMHLDRLAERFPGAALATWVREPVQRLVSFYQYWQREPDWRHPLCRTLHERRLSLLEFARLEEARNEMSRYFGRYDPADFSFIGIFERLPESMELFFRILALPPQPFGHERRNLAKTADAYPLTPEEHAEIAALNAADCALYRDCLAWFERHRAAAQPACVPASPA